MRYHMMDIKEPILSLEQVKAILKPQYEYLAKSRGEVLWLHSFAAWSILSKLAARIPRFTEKERLLLEISALIHDIGKMRTKSQEILTGKQQGKLPHTATKEEIKTYLLPFISDNMLQLEDKDIDSIWEFALHHHISEKQQKEAEVPAYGIYGEVVRYADWLASMERLDMTTIRQIQNSLEGICRLTVFSVGRQPSPTTYLLLQMAIEEYHRLRWETLVVFDDSVVFIGNNNMATPARQEIAERFTKQLTNASFKAISIQNRYMRYEILSGPAKENPYQFLQCRQDEYNDKLGDIEIGPVLFLRTLMDLYKHSDRLSNKIRKQKPVLDILSKAGGTNGITQAKQEWNKKQGLEVNKEWPSTNALVVDIFNNISLGDVLSDIEPKKNKPLSDMTHEELLNILLEAAKDWFPDSEGSQLRETIANIIAMEEETDFTAFASEVFKKYKDYKKSRRPRNALCEQCGFPIPIVATESLNFPQSSGFSQINPRPESDAPKIVCPLCVFDATQMREELTRNRSQIYARVVSRIPELWQIYGDLKTRIDRLRQSLTNVREIRQLSSTEFSDLPLPPNFDIPIATSYKETITEIPVHTARGTLFPIEKANKKTSPKDFRAKYLAFYALLNMLGLETHMGFEEQEGLFGENIFEKCQRDWQTLYFKGLIIVILAATIKKNNGYVFVQDLLERNPSVILSILENGKIKKELMEKVVTFLIGADWGKISSKGGDYSMKEILKDAAFFAEWIPKFFWGTKDYDSWRRGGSKYVITKPVDKVLNGLLQGNDFEEAFAKFISSLKEDISSDKSKKDSKATVDVKDLQWFVSEAKKIFQRYAELKSSNITRFIQAKNGLRSAIYIVKRYENLKEVINNESAK